MSDRQYQRYARVMAAQAAVLLNAECPSLANAREAVEATARARRDAAILGVILPRPVAALQVVRSAYAADRERFYRPAVRPLRSGRERRSAASRRGSPTAKSEDGDSDPDPPPHYKPRQAADLLYVPYRTFYDRLKAGRVPRIPTGKGKSRPRFVIPGEYVRGVLAARARRGVQ